MFIQNHDKVTLKFKNGIIFGTGASYVTVWANFPFKRHTYPFREAYIVNFKTC